MQAAHLDPVFRRRTPFVALSLFAILGLAGRAGAAGVNLIDAKWGVGVGSFENGTWTETTLGTAFDNVPGPDVTTITGWSVAGAAGVDWLDSTLHAALDGTKSIDLYGASGAIGSISTTVKTVAGKPYRISFGAYGGAIPNTATVSAGSLVAQPFGGPTYANPLFAKYAMYHFTFTALAATTTITFAASTTDGFGPVIDDVGVYEGGVGNYLALMNGIDAVDPVQLNGGSPDTGIAKLFDARILHAPTLDLSAGNGYAAKISALEFGVVTDPGVDTIVIPMIEISSFVATPAILSAGAWPVSVASGGIPTYKAIRGPGAIVRYQKKDLTFPVNAEHSNGVTQITIPIDPPVVIPIGENAILYIADAPESGSGSVQHFVLSDDESNGCDSFSLRLDSTNTITRSLPNEEWMAGLRMVDAVTIPVTNTFGPGTLALNAHDGFGMDSGTGARTPSLGRAGGSQIGFLTYDENSLGGPAGHLVIFNLGGLTTPPTPTCGNITFLASGGAYGPVLTTAPPEKPCIVPKIDSLTNALLSVAPLTLHDTLPGPNGVNVPWYPERTVGNSGATSVTGGAMLAIPNVPAYVGIELFFATISLSVPHTSLAVGNVHSHSMGHSLILYP